MRGFIAGSLKLYDLAKCKYLLFQHGRNAAALSVAEKYVGAFGNLAKSTNTVIVPANTGDAAGMVAQVPKINF